MMRLPLHRSTIFLAAAATIAGLASEAIAQPERVRSEAAAPSPFMGRWELDLTRMPSTYGPPPKRVIYSFQDIGEGTWRMVVDITGQDGSVRHMAASYRPDGKMAPSEGETSEADSVAAFRHLLDKYPESRGVATLIQIASPSREDVDAYNDILQELESLCGSINGNFGELDWMPVRYLHRTVARARLPGLYRASRVALVTPLRDGMNLVAKEFIVAQNPEDPGVLVLSRFAGAAEQLKEALLVNPYDTHGTAETVQQALQMPLEERRARHQRLLQRIREQDVH